MTPRRLAHLRHVLTRCFPERRVYLHSKGEVRALVLTSERQALIGAAAAAVALWTVVSAGSAVGELAAAHRPAPKPAATAGHGERNSPLLALIRRAEQRDAALASLLTSLGANAEAPVLRAGPPLQTLAAIQADQDRLVQSAESFARARTARLAAALKLAGVNPARRAQLGVGGPLIEVSDPQAVAAMKADGDFAQHVEAAAQTLAAMRALQSTAAVLPLNKPVANPVKSSGFGVRTDPFTHKPAFHPGQDFAGGYRQPIYATAPGVVSFTGVRTGYGNTVEIKHADGFMTRYGHLAAFKVKPGQPVAEGQEIAAMGSTGRSTGVHLHYEVWRNGKLQDPSRYLRAGDQLGLAKAIKTAAAQPAPLALRQRSLLRLR